MKRTFGGRIRCPRLLARAAASHTGFTAGHHQVLTDPTLAKFQDTLERLHRNARGIHAKHDDPAAPADDRLEWHIDAALVDLTDLCTPQERRRLTVNRYL